jgi:hypothetical protein
MCSPNRERIKMKFEKFDSRKQIRGLAEAAKQLQEEERQENLGKLRKNPTKELLLEAPVQKVIH